MGRPFPLIRTFNNLLWNIRHYQHPQKRPAFKATRHPFCTNQQLRDASCTYWLKETTKDFGQRLLERRNSSKTTQRKTPFSTGTSKGTSIVTLAGARSTIENQEVASADCPDQKTSVVHLAQEFSPAEKQIIQLFQDAEFSKMYELLKALEDEGTKVSKDIIMEIISRVYENPPNDTSMNYLLRSTTEEPLFFIKYSLRSQGRYSDYSTHVKNLYDIASSIEKKEGLSKVDESFLKAYIWLCYHMEDLSTLQRLSYQYLQRPAYDSRTLSYIINAFTYSFDVEYAKSLFLNIIEMNRPLDESLLSSTLSAFIRVRALHENVREIFMAWQSNPGCESPHPKTMAMMANQTYIYGTEREIAAMEADIQSLGYESNFLVQMTKMQTSIVVKDTNQKKTVTQDELKSILEVRNTLGRTKYALGVYYESYIRFFCIHCDMNLVQFILKEMKRDGIPLSRFCYEKISNHYVKEAKFFQLFEFIKKFVTKFTRFDLFFVKQIFLGFVKTYPHYAEAFSDAFDLWLQETPHLSTEEKKVLREECQVTKSNSAIKPVISISKESKNKLKYPTLEAISGNFRDKYHKRNIVHHTEEQGIKSLLRRGIRPNYFFIEELLKKSNKRERSKLLQSLTKIRMTRTVTRLKIYHFLMSYPKKHQFAEFYRQISNELNTSDKILLARRTLNAHDYETTSLILDSIGSSDMTDSRQMLLLNLSLRNNLGSNNLSACSKNLESFAMDKITLSPYIHTQCRYIEKEVQKKIESCTKQAEVETGSKESGAILSIEELVVFLHQLQGFIGDIQIRLKKDKSDVKMLIGDTFHLLSQWAEYRRTYDNRKV